MIYFAMIDCDCILASPQTRFTLHNLKTTKLNYQNNYALSEM